MLAYDAEVTTLTPDLKDLFHGQGGKELDEDLEKQARTSRDIDYMAKTPHAPQLQRKRKDNDTATRRDVRPRRDDKRSDTRATPAPRQSTSTWTRPDRHDGNYKTSGGSGNDRRGNYNNNNFRGSRGAASTKTSKKGYRGRFRR